MERKGEIAKASDGRPAKASSQARLIPGTEKPKAKTLAELGVSYDQSSQWKELAESTE
jgi:hypothetical protein